MNKLILILITALSGSAFAGSIIANNDLKMAAGDVNDVFTGEKSTIDGVKVVVVDNKSAMGDFCSKVMKMDTGKYTALWAKKAFRDGVPSPKSKTSDAEVIDFVKATSGAVGYISGAAGGGVKEVTSF